jgi:hypothetical protein
MGPSPIVIVAAVLAAIVLTVENMTKGKTARARSGSFYAFANAIAFAEGFGVPGAIPTVRNNPGDLKLPADGGAITTFATPADGWEALYKQLDLIRTGASRYYQPTMTIDQVARVWTATEQSIWRNNVLTSMSRQGYNVTAGTVIGDVLS